jgi:hypothetical protein
MTCSFPWFQNIDLIVKQIFIEPNIKVFAMDKKSPPWGKAKKRLQVRSMIYQVLAMHGLEEAWLITILTSPNIPPACALLGGAPHAMSDFTRTFPHTA